MTKEQTNSWEKEFDNLFNSCGFDHLDYCRCTFADHQECKCVSYREKFKQFIFKTISQEKQDIKDKIKLAGEYYLQNGKLEAVEVVNNIINLI